MKPLVLKDINFWERTSLFEKLPFLSPYNTFYKFQNLFSCFDIVFVQLLVIEKTRNKIVEIEVVTECYPINWRTKSNELLFRINLNIKFADRRMSKKWDNLLLPKLKYCQFEQSQIAEKREPVSWMISWIWLVVKFGLRAIMTRQERAPILSTYKHWNCILRPQLLTDS